MSRFSFVPINAPTNNVTNEDDSMDDLPINESNAGALQKTAQNLLVHIPGESSGLYLMAVDAFEKPSGGILIFIAVLALTVLIVVRWIAEASRALMIVSIIAFLIWMFVLDKGVLNHLFPNALPNPLGLIIAVFYSTIITLLANSGKIK